MSEIKEPIQTNPQVESSPEKDISQESFKQGSAEDMPNRVISVPEIEEKLDVIPPVVAKTGGGDYRGFIIPQDASEENMPKPIRANFRKRNDLPPLV